MVHVHVPAEVKGHDTRTGAMAFRGWVTVGRGWLRRLRPEDGLEQLPQVSALHDTASQPVEFFSDLLDYDVAGQDLAERLG